MMPTTISVSDETRKALQRIKLRDDKRSLEEVIQALLAEHRSTALRRVQEQVQARMTELGLTPEDMVDRDLLE